MVLLRILLLSLLLPVFAVAQRSIGDSALHYFTTHIDTLDYNTPEWQLYADTALAIDSTVAPVWELKSMPYLKDGDFANCYKYMRLSAKYDPVHYEPLVAFEDFAAIKDYKRAIKDFLYCKEKGYGMGIMDHTYEFYLGVAYKQAGYLDKAEEYLLKSINSIIKTTGEDWVHYNEWFYLGIVYIDKGDNKNAIKYLDKCLKAYPGYPNALYYKARVLATIGKEHDALQLLQQAETNINNGIKSTEDNDFYDNYPDEIYVADIDMLRQEIDRK